MKNPRNVAHVKGAGELGFHVIDSLPNNLKLILSDMFNTGWYQGRQQGIRTWG